MLATAERILKGIVTCTGQDKAVSNTVIRNSHSHHVDPDEHTIEVRRKTGQLSHRVSAPEALLYLRAKVVDVKLDPKLQKIHYLRMRRDYPTVMRIVLDTFYSGRSGFLAEDNRTIVRLPGGKGFEHHTKHCGSFSAAVRPPIITPTSN